MKDQHLFTLNQVHMKTEVVAQKEFDLHSTLGWGRTFFICLGFASLYYIAYLALLVHIIVRPGTTVF
ncbi:MAG: hypothetical protein C5B59_02600 [Bacteroidetes bacterium]|nr:MAG: hypothetical protein C5B59_02600 [Bacteroidota bacterium]